MSSCCCCVWRGSALWNGWEKERERRLEPSSEREKTGRKISGSSNGNKSGTHIKIVRIWIHFESKNTLLAGYSQICYGTHIKFKLEFQTSLKLCVPNKFFFSVGPSDCVYQTESQFENNIPNTLLFTPQQTHTSCIVSLGLIGLYIGPPYGFCFWTRLQN